MYLFAKLIHIECVLVDSRECQIDQESLVQHYLYFCMGILRTREESALLSQFDAQLEYESSIVRVRSCV